MGGRPTLSLYMEVYCLGQRRILMLGKSLLLNDITHKSFDFLWTTQCDSRRSSPSAVDGLEVARLSWKLVQTDVVSHKIATILSEELIKGSITSSQP